MNTKKPTRKPSTFTAEERSAMRERAKELKATKNKADGEEALLEKIAEMEGSDRVMAARLHRLVKKYAPELKPTTWYGMPAYSKDGKVVCFFQAARKFKTRYATLGFSDKANLDDGGMWPVAFALKAMMAIEEAMVVALVKSAVK